MKQGERFKRIQFINTAPTINPDVREEQNYLLNNRYLVCTDVCARGMDLHNVGLVIHFERSLTQES